MMRRAPRSEPCARRRNKTYVRMRIPTSFAYLFERFPSFVQTFVYREAVEMVRQKMNPWLVSIRRPEDPGNLAGRLNVEIFYALRKTRSFVPRSMRAGRGGNCRGGRIEWSRSIGGKPTPSACSRRSGSRQCCASKGVFACPRTPLAAWPRARRGGCANSFGLSYSFTGHANDIFCDTDFPVSNGDLVRGGKIRRYGNRLRAAMDGRHLSLGKGKGLSRFQRDRPGGLPVLRPVAGIPRIVSVGRYVEKKGFSILIEACRLLQETAVLSFECERLSAGGPLEPELRTQIEQSGLGGVVRLSGPRAQVRSAGSGWPKRTCSSWRACPRRTVVVTIFPPSSWRRWRADCLSCRPVWRGSRR